MKGIFTIAISCLVWTGGLQAQCWEQVASGYDFSVGIKTDGTLWEWGSGIGSSPVQIGTDADWIQVSVGNDHVLALKFNHTLWAWGYNSDGQVGDGTNVSKFDPVQIGTDNHWRLLEAGYNHSMAIKEDRTLWAWGSNDNGQLGIDNNDNQYFPAQVFGLWNIIATGYGHTLGRFFPSQDLTLWAWGSSLGNGTMSDIDYPINIGSLQGIQHLAAGFECSAVIANGSLFTWGYNVFGQLGDGTTNNSYDMIQVGEDGEWESIEFGGYHALAIKNNGTLWAWGKNTDGQLGIGNTTDHFTPVQVGSDSDWQMISAGKWHSLAVKNDGSLWAWGWNLSGQLGNGTYDDSLFPIQVECPTISTRDLALPRDHFKVFPNPANDHIILQSAYPNPPDLKFEVRNTLGETIIGPQKLTDDQWIETGHWAQGMYLIYLTGEEGRISLPLVKM